MGGFSSRGWPSFIAITRFILIAIQHVGFSPKNIK